MIATWMLETISILVISFIAGFLSFYMVSSLSSQTKRKQIDEMVSLLINFVLFIWVAKVVLNIDVFLSDPFAVLAYPSNSHAFYLATLFSMIHIGYKVWRKSLDIVLTLYTFVHVFLFASFVYEFIQIVWVKDSYTWGLIGLLFVLLLVLVFLTNHLSKKNLSLVMIIGWSIGQLILALSLPYTTVFGYMLAPWFLVVILLVSLFSWLFYRD
ncbi:hypothetical protein [Oceanobacillus halotolerans]|uniref:hypothetical protein n=1 Tax=Oceanobacillus halotolerans TaxID=2663380 RepID=UPI001969F30A|nr:hypothetical protein [Oceanobacillus halotolerans]